MGSPDRPWLTVVGIVGDVKHNELTGAVKPKFYRPGSQFHLSSGNPPRNMNLVVKTAGDPRALARSIRTVAQRVAPSVPLAGVRTMDEVVAASKGTRRFAGSLLFVFAGLALALAAVGVYGILSYAVSERTPEIGVRMALGARPRDVLRLVVGQGAARVAVGVAVGVALGLGLTRLMQGLLYGVRPTDPLTFAAVTAVLMAVGIAAAWLPARRAAGVDPMTALRHE